jgi:inward rectifier potassium channel
MASFEALIGLLTFALATGLFYARFSKPKAYLRFSANALIAPYRDGIALMMRVAPFKNTNLTDAEAKISLGMSLEENGKMVNKFFPLELEFDKINALALSWTIVHPITENSPLYKFTPEDYAASNGEVLVYLKAFDDMYSNTVVSRTSYTFRELVIGAKFIPMYHRNTEGNSTILDFEKIGMYKAADISFAFNTAETAVNG